MTFQVRHDWHKGATIAGAELATCAHCQTLRVTESPTVHYVKREAQEDRRVLRAEPPCVGAPAFFRAPW